MSDDRLIDTNTTGDPDAVDHLDIIRSSKTSSEGEIIINNGFLEYTPWKTSEAITLINRSSEFRPITCSELSRVLTEKGYFRVGMSYFDTLERIKVNPVNLDGEIPVIEVNHNISGKFSSGIPYSGSKGVSSEVKRVIEQGLKTVYGNYVEKNPAYQESVSTNTTDNMEDISVRPVEFTVISPSSDVYTDSVNLGEYIYHTAAPYFAGMVRADVRYSYFNSIVIKSAVFSAFNYDADCNLTLNNLILPLDSFVQLEYFNGVLRAVPLDSIRVNECIINNCTLTYARY